MAHGALRAGVLAASAAGAFLAFFSVQASAQPASQTAPRSLSQVERDRAAATAQAQRLRAQAANVRTDVAALDQRLVEAGRRRAEAEAAATDAEARLVTLRQHAATDGARYSQDRNSFEAALGAAAFAQRQFEPNLIHIGMLAASVAPLFAKRMHTTAQAIDEARQRDAEIVEEQHNLVAAQQAIDSERAQVITLLAQRRARQTTLTANADAADRRARLYASEARSLRELAQRVQSARNASRPAPAGAPSVIPASWLAPASGAITHAFGAQTAGGPPTQGVTVHTRPGAQVVAPARAEVAYAGPFRSYGQVLILNRDDGYVMVLAGLGNVRARVGETVIAGQPIGEMAASAMPAPELYVEIRRNGQPIDPGRWLAARWLAAGPSREDAG